MKKLIVSILLIIVSGFGAYYILTPTKDAIPKHDEFHYHAGFVVFENGKKIDFSDSIYMNIKPCSEDGAEEVELSKAHLQMEKAHLHDNVGDIVHSHVDPNLTTWKYLFTNIKYDFDYSKTTGYVNGVKVENFQNQKINPYDSLVLFKDEVDEKLLSDAVKKGYIEEKEKVGNCSD